MIAHLRGRLLRLTPEEVVLDVDGVGYGIEIPLSTYYELERLGEGGEAALHVHTHVREDALELFGFWTLRERGLFEQLIGVSGIGPRLARVVLSGMAPVDLAAALSAGDVARLSTIPGIGKKTAERMVLELRDKVADLVAAGVAPASAADDDLVAALVNLGYRERDADKAVREVAADAPEADFSELLRLSLRKLARLS